MKKLIILILFSFTMGILAAQWQFQNPIPQGNHLNDVQFINNHVGIAVGDFGTVIKTIDGGVTWEILNSGTTENLLKISIIDMDTIWIISSEGSVISSFDGGNLWTLVASGITDNIKDGVFTDNGKGWIIKANYLTGEHYSAIYHTSDGGVTWEAQFDSTDILLKSMHFVDENTGWVAGTVYDSVYTYNYEGVILTTTNGGDSWDMVNFPGKYFTDITFLDALNGWALGVIIGYEHEIWKTNDGGITWIFQTGNEYASYWKLQFNDEHHGWVLGWQQLDGCGSKPFILHTTDGGESWNGSLWMEGQYCPSFINSFWFSDNQNGWIVGSSGIIGHSSNGGSSWESLSGIYSPANLKDIIFTDELNGWAIGDCPLPSIGIVMKSTNGGNTWEELNLEYPFNFHYSSVEFFDINQGWIVGSTWQPKGKIIYTDDGGENWIESYTLEGYGLNDICSIDQSNSWTVGDNGKILHYNGTDWTEQLSNITDDLFGVYFIDQNKGWAVGDEGTIISTLNGGSDWNIQQSETALKLSKVYFTDENNGWVAGSGDYFGIIGNNTAIILHTDDGGTTWETQFTDTNYYFSDIQFIDTLVGWVVGPEKIMKTTNGGNTWGEENIFSNVRGESIYFLNENSGWIAGDHAKIIHTSNGGGVSKTPDICKVNAHFSAYPNPMQAFTNFEYVLDGHESAEIIIYNISGKLIERISFEEMNMGKNRIIWKAEGLPAGIYFSTLITSENTFTKKIIKL